MNTERIELLLQRFYDAQTTDEEERELSDLLLSAGDDLPAHLQADRELFGQLEAARAVVEVPVPQGMEERLSQLIDSQEQAARPKARIVGLRQWGMAAAASVALLVVVGIGQFKSQPQTIEVTDPEEAYQLTCQALALFSETLDAGMAQMEQANASVTDVYHVVEEQFNY